MCVSIVTGSLSQYSVPFHPSIHSFSSLYIYPTLYPNPMKQTAARYFPFSFVLTYSVVLDPVLSPGVLHSLRRSPCDAVSGDISCGGPGPLCVRGAFPGLGVVLPLLLAALRPSVVLAASVSRRSACCSAGVNRSSTFPSWT